MGGTATRRSVTDLPEDQSWKPLSSAKKTTEKFNEVNTSLRSVVRRGKWLKHYFAK